MATNSDILAALNEIIDKLGAIDPCTPVSVNLPNITLVCGDCGGIEPESPDVTQDDPPPAGYEPDSGIDARKCKAANYIHDQIYNLIYTLDQIGLDTILTFSYYQVKQMVSTALLGAGIFATTYAFVTHVLDEIINYLLGTTITLSSVLNAMDAGKTNLVCALYNAQSTSQAKNDYITELQNQGITDQESIAVFGYFLINDVTRMLFHAIPGSEAALDGYVSTVDCASCSQLPDYDCIMGSWYHQGGNRYRVEAYYNGANYFIYLGNNSIKFNVENVSLISGTVEFTTPETTEIKTGTTKNYCGAGVQDNQYDWSTNNIINVYNFLYRSHQPFTVELDIIGI